MDRLEELMESKLKNDMDVRIFTNRVVVHLVRKLKSLDADPSSHELQIIAKIIAAGFQSGENNTTGGNAIASIFASTSLDDAILQSLLEHLIGNPRVLVSAKEITRIENQLRDANLPTRAKMILLLRRKNASYSRWMKTPLADLLKEAQHLETREGIKPAALCALYDVILKKTKTTYPIDMDILVEILPKFLDQTKKLHMADVDLYRREIFETLNAAIERALVERRGEVLDKLWVLKPLRVYQIDHILLYTLSLCERDQQEKANEWFKMLKELNKHVEDLDLKRVLASRYFSTFLSEQLLEGFLSLLSQHFNISQNWDRRLRTTVRLNNLNQLIKERRLNEAYELVDHMDSTMFHAPGDSFPVINLLKALLMANDADTVKKVFNLVQTRCDANTAVIYTGIACLELNNKAQGSRYLNGINHVPSRLLFKLTKREFKARRADVLHTLFNVFNKPENSSIDLEQLLEDTITLYYDKRNLEGLRTLFDDVRSSSFPLSGKLRFKIETFIKKLEHSGGGETSTPQPSHRNSPPLASSENAAPAEETK